MTGRSQRASPGPATEHTWLRPVEQPPPGPDGGVRVRRVRKAYEQVADQLRELILTGKIAPGERLSNETMLARDFGVSRATVREALRVLAAQNLLRTAKGAGGGSYVTLPTVDHISAFLQSNIGLLTEARDLTLDELIEVRRLLEVPAARLAAERRRAEDLERLAAAIPEQPLRLDRSAQFDYNKEFHSAVIDACGNRLLTIAAQPVFSALQTRLARSTLGRTFHREINAHHGLISEAIAAGEADAAGLEMERHLEFLVPYYEKAWRHLKRTRA